MSQFNQCKHNVSLDLNDSHRKIMTKGIYKNFHPVNNLLHKLHILGHFFSINSGSDLHMACVRLPPHSLSKSAQSPDKARFWLKNLLI